MKVNRSSGAQGTSKSKKTPQGSGVDGSFSDMLTAGLSQASTAAPSQSIAQVDALLAIQGAEDPTHGAAKKRMCARADGLLDLLDDIRGAMLSGNLNVGDMLNVADTIASHRERINDPKLTALLDEIDLRAQVELAKMRVALDKNMR